MQNQATMISICIFHVANSSGDASILFGSGFVLTVSSSSAAETRPAASTALTTTIKTLDSSGFAIKEDVTKA
jgi:hypothetical protein